MGDIVLKNNLTKLLVFSFATTLAMERLPQGEREEITTTLTLKGLPEEKKKEEIALTLRLTTMSLKKVPTHLFWQTPSLYDAQAFTPLTLVCIKELSLHNNEIKRIRSHAFNPFSLCIHSI